ncbi:hypothetical protein D3C76_1205980 [compost metagenome]
MAAAVAQTQGVAGLCVHPEFHLGAAGKLMGAGEGMHHHEGPALGAPLDRNILIHEQPAFRADGPHPAGAHGRLAAIPAHSAHIPRLIGPEVALGVEGGEIGDQQAGLPLLAIDDAGLFLMMAQHEADSGMFHGKASATRNREEKAAAYAKAGAGSLTSVNEPARR